MPVTGSSGTPADGANARAWRVESASSASKLNAYTPTVSCSSESRSIAFMSGSILPTCSKKFTGTISHGRPVFARATGISAPTSASVAVSIPSAAASRSRSASRLVTSGSRWVIQTVSSVPISISSWPTFVSRLWVPLSMWPSSCRAAWDAMVACPQRSTSCVGVKYRIWRSAVADEVMNAVSLAPNSVAIACNCRSLRPFASGTTPAAFPRSGVSVNASTSRARRCCIR